MSAITMDGRALASQIKAELATKVSALKAQGIAPGLGTILVGDDAGSRSYVAGKHRDCQEVGITSIRIDLPASATESDVLAAVSELNSSQECSGYIVQLPLPTGINTQRIIEAIDPVKDADGLHPVNLGRLVAGFAGPLPCTPRAIVALLHHYSISFDGAEVMILGRGLTVGRPLSLLLSSKSANATVTVVHTKTKNVKDHIKRADIVIAAMGQPHMVTAEMIKPGATVIDVGISRAGSELIGDVHPGVKDIAAFVAPMPGGVGPMTRAMLLTNVVEACQR